jgi:hypothetical protein
MLEVERGNTRLPSVDDSLKQIMGLSYDSLRNNEYSTCTLTDRPTDTL